MGGRPGQAVCRRLFERRGFRINKLWQTKVLQASNTDSIETSKWLHFTIFHLYQSSIHLITFGVIDMRDGVSTQDELLLNGCCYRLLTRIYQP